MGQLLCPMVSHGHNQTHVATGQRALGTDCPPPGTPMAATVSAPWEIQNDVEKIPGADHLRGARRCHMHCRRLAQIWPEKLWKPHPWKCPRPDWMGLWATQSSERCPWPWQGGWTRWALNVLSDSNHSVILWCLNVHQGGALALQLLGTTAGTWPQPWSCLCFPLRSRNKASSKGELQTLKQRQAD